jgi:dienelactone hydrolase
MFFAAQSQPSDRAQIIASQRLDNSGKPIQIPYRTQSASPSPKAVLLVLPGLNKPAPQSLEGAETYEPAYSPVRRNHKGLLEAGFALAWMGWPSESQFGISGLRHPDFFKDISTVIDKTRQQWPSAPLLLTSTDGASTAVLSYALKHKSKLDGLLTFAPAWAQDRELPVETLQGLPGLVLHDAVGECIAISKVEIEEISARAGFQRVAIPASIPSVLGRCSPESTHWMTGLDTQLPGLLKDWLDKQALTIIPPSGATTAPYAERVLLGDSPSGKMEITVITPAGPGPFPLVLFNHGDVEMDSAYIKHKQRFRDHILSATFVRWGFAVAFPERPGVGRSDGIYRYANYAIHDADASYKARQHTQVIQKALERLRQEPDLNSEEIVLAGQSAGGDAVMYMSTLNSPGVKAVVNFSGGRTNHAQGQNANFENKMMIEGWRELGSQAKVPVMLVFAENDSRYTANTVRKAAQAFNESGGKAELLLLPPIQGDGHFVYQQPRLWSRQAWAFVRQQQIGKGSSTTFADLPNDKLSKATAQSHPTLFDLQSLPVQSEACKDIYLRFLNAPLPRFFAVGIKGRGCGYSSVAENSAEKALKFCEDRVGTCRLYAKDNELLASEVR